MQRKLAFALFIISLIICATAVVALTPEVRIVTPPRVYISMPPTSPGAFSTSVTKSGNAAALAWKSGDIWLAAINDGAAPVDSALATLLTNAPLRVDRLPAAGDDLYCEVILTYKDGGNALHKEGSELPRLQGSVTLLKKNPASGGFTAMSPTVTSGWQNISFSPTANTGLFAVRTPATTVRVGDEYKAYIQIRAENNASGTAGDALATLKCKIEARMGVAPTII